MQLLNAVMGPGLQVGWFTSVSATYTVVTLSNPSSSPQTRLLVNDSIALTSEGEVRMFQYLQALVDLPFHQLEQYTAVWWVVGQCQGGGWAAGQGRLRS